MFLQIAPVCFCALEGLFVLFFGHQETYDDDYTVKLYLHPGPVKAGDLWTCRAFWILCNLISRAKGASSSKLHIKPFIILILYSVTFTH